MGFLSWFKDVLGSTFQLNDDDVVVFLVGPSGSGKSAFLNAVTRSGIEVVGTNFRHPTLTPQAIRRELTEEEKPQLGVSSQKNIVFVDTPSFHTGGTNQHEGADKEMANWLNKANFRSTHIGTIYMHSVETNPENEPIQPHLSTFAGTLPPSVVSHALPERLLAVFYNSEGIDKNIDRHRGVFQTQLCALRPSKVHRKVLRWDTSLHPDLFRSGDSETAWKAVVALFSTSCIESGQRPPVAPDHPKLSTPPKQDPPAAQNLPAQETPAEPAKDDAGHYHQTNGGRSEEGREQIPDDGSQSDAELHSDEAQEEKANENTGHAGTDEEPPEAEEAPAEVSVEELRSDDIVIAVMGPTGAGKSSLISTASGIDKKVIGHSMRSFTNKVQAIKFWEKENGRYVVLVDTPGFDDTNKSDLDILTMISKWLNSSYDTKKLLSGILYLHRITDNRMAGTPLKNLRMFEKLCGDDALDKVYFTTTMWDEVAPGVGETRLKELQTEYWNTMIEQGAQTYECKSMEGSKRLIRDIVFKDEERRALQLQHEMGQQKMKLKETAAGKHLFSELEQLVMNQSELLQKIAKERKAAASDPEALAELQEEYVKLREQVDNKLRQMEELKLTWFKSIIRLPRIPMKLLRRGRGD